VANQQAYLGQSGAVYYDDAIVGWYPAPNDALPLRGALCSQMYITDDPVDELEIANKKYVDALCLFELNTDDDIQPTVKSGGYYNIVPRVTGNGNIGTAALMWAGVFSGAFVIADAGTIGLGSGKGLIQFDDETTNFVSFSNCNVGIGTTTPGVKLDFGTSAANGKIIVGTYTGGGYWTGIGADASTGIRIAGDPTSAPSAGFNLLDVGYYSINASLASATWTSKMIVLNNGSVGIGDSSPGELLDVAGNINATGVLKIDDVQVVSNRVIDARCDDAINSGDATTDGVIDALRDAMITHGLIAAA